MKSSISKLIGTVFAFAVIGSAVAQQPKQARSATDPTQKRPPVSTATRGHIHWLNKHIAIQKQIGLSAAQQAKFDALNVKYTNETLDLYHRKMPKSQLHQLMISLQDNYHAEFVPILTHAQLVHFSHLWNAGMGLMPPPSPTPAKNRKHGG